MKKTFLAYSIAATLSLTTINAAAQTSNLPVQSTAEYTSFSNDPGPANGMAAASTSEVNIKAMKNFTRDYKNPSSTTWFKLQDGFVVYFTQKEIAMRVAYDKKGNYLWTIRNYSENELPFEVRDLVKSRYYDFTIHHIDEVKSNEGIAYTIKLEGKTTWKTIKVVNSEMTVINDYVKN